MTNSAKTKLKIQKLDFRGQGVSWDLDRITFVPQALPGEEVEIQRTKIHAHEQWGVITKILQASPQRITPACPHYASCAGCQYLHMAYPDEIAAKAQVLQEQLAHIAKINPGQLKIQIHPAEQRHTYRQRLQLHYDWPAQKIGFLNGLKIIPVPHCQLPLPPLAKTLEKIYQDPATWQPPAAQPPRGHLELAVWGKQVKWSWNRPYAAGGFCQVNPAMNAQLKNVWQEIFREQYQENCLEKSAPQTPDQDFREHHAPASILDLFGGQGNLSASLATHHRALIVDAVAPSHPFALPFLAADLYAPTALATTLTAAAAQDLRPPLTWLIVDPPRSGFKQIAPWAQAWAAQNILYVSCNAATLARDLATLLPTYHLQQLHLFDFFPGTAHFESMAVLQKKM